jgi:hypothetical protein
MAAHRNDPVHDSGCNLTRVTGRATVDAPFFCSTVLKEAFMSSARVVTAFALAASVGFIVANCGGSSSSDTNSAINNISCSMSGTSTCTAAQTKPYTDCLFSKCDAAFTACYGSGYKSGTFSGPCSTYITCLSKCGCSDSACRTACGQPSAECISCETMIGTCVLSAGCMYPTCTGAAGADGAAGAGGAGGAGGTGGGGSGCAGLTACCNAMTMAAQKAQCLQAVSGLMSNDQACSSLLAVYRAGQQCP